MKAQTTKNCQLVAQRLYELRLQNGLTQNKLAKQARIDRKTVNRIENGHFSPSLSTLFRLCRVLKVQPEKLFKGVKQ
jgi:putative transcriptional regulator